MSFSTIHLRRFLALAFIVMALLLTAMPVQAQMRAQLAEKVAVDAANQLVAKISGESCSQFASTMSKMKGQGSSATPSPMSARLKSNSQARTQFVNIVAGPLLNKMIDCNMLPGGM